MRVAATDWRGPRAWIASGRSLVVISLLMASALVDDRADAAPQPSVVVTPTAGLNWGDPVGVTTSGYGVQESAYITICDPGTIGVPLTIAEVNTACSGELEHRFDVGFDPNTNWGFINGANGSDTLVLTDGRASSGHCSTGTCDVVVLDHNCIDQVSGTCTYQGHAIMFAWNQSGPGQFRVTTNPAVPAEISVDGIVRDSWGLNWPKFPAGPHQVCFGDVPGYATPPCQDVSIINGTTTAVQGSYVQRGLLQVTTSPAVASTISVDGVARNDWGLWTEIAPGTHNVCFGAVAGFNVPACRDVAVSAGVTSATTGTFTVNPSAPGPGGTFGFLRATTSPATNAVIRVDGVARNTWGLDWVKLPVGQHEVCFGAVPNLTAPASCSTADITDGATSTITGTYVARGFLRVITDPLPANANITINGEIADAYGVWTSKAPGFYDVCFWPLIGKVTPPCQNDVEVMANSTITVTGTYSD